MLQQILDKGATISIYQDGNPASTTVIAPYVGQTDGKFAWFDLVERRDHLFRNVKLTQEHDLAWWIISADDENLAYITLISEDDPSFQEPFEDGWLLASGAAMQGIQEGVDMMLEDAEEED